MKGMVEEILQELEAKKWFRQVLLEARCFEVEVV
jgi:hypothetical protein